MPSLDLPAPWHCPICGAPLTLEERGYRCVANHRFDLAREGYVNLLPAHRKRSAEPGDNKAMVRGRREFLERGYYRPLAATLAEIAIEAARATAPLRLLDTGCGEGYYTGHIAETLRATLPGQPRQLAGSDIAKEAVRIAAKRHRAIHFAVAGSNALPVADGSLDLMLCVFAPHYPGELARCLKPGGLFVHVTPGAHHLMALRRLIYDTPKAHDEAEPRIEGLRHLERRELRFELAIDHPGDPARLLAMTPYYWSADEATQARIAGLERLDTEADFRIDIHRR